jgi:hypothetical protein
MGAHELRAVGLQTIPDDQQLLADRRLQGFEKLGDLRTLDRAVEQAKVEVPIDDPGNYRQLLPAEAVLQYRRLTLGSPRSRATRSLGQTRFVDKDDSSALSRSDRFSAGYLLAFQVRIARSATARSSPAVRAAATLRRGPSRPRTSPRSAAQSGATSTAPSRPRRPSTLPSAITPVPPAAIRTAVPGARSVRRDGAPAVLPVGAAAPRASPSGELRPPDVQLPLAAVPQPTASPRAVGVALVPYVSLRASSVPRM